LVVAELIEANHAALWELTGRDVIAVFHTLSAGKTGHLVPGNIVLATRACAGADAALVVAIADARGAAIATPPIATTSARAARFDDGDLGDMDTIHA
jgi:hypothetical protein